MTRPRRRVRRLVLIACGLLLALTYAPTHRWEDEYLVFERDAGGEMVRDGDTEISLGVRLDRGRSWADVTATNVASPAASAGKIATRRVWFLDVTGERLLRETALMMQSELKVLDWVQETAYFPRTYQPLHESTLPDIFVTLELIESSELHLPLFRRFDHTLRVGIGRRPLRSTADPVSYRSAAHAELVVRVHGRFFGLTSAARKHDRSVAALARAIDVVGRLADWRARFGAIEGAPEELIEAERGLPALPLPESPDRHQLYQGGYFLVHTEAMWAQPVRENARADLAEIVSSFEGAGWTRLADVHEAAAFTHGPLYFEAVPVPGALVLFLQDRYSPAEARALFERCLAERDPNRARLFLEHVFPSLRADLLAALREGPNPIALEDAWVRLLSR